MKKKSYKKLKKNARYNLDPECGISIWTPAESDIAKDFIDTDHILDTVVYSERSDAKVAVLLPLELR